MAQNDYPKGPRGPIPENLLQRILRETKTIVSHRNCADGFLSAILLADALPRAKVVMLAHGSARDEMPATPGLLFCDMSPPEARRREFADAGAIVLDHHASARGLFVEGKDGAPALEGVYSDTPGVSGAVLAFEVWQHTKQADVPAWVLRKVRDFARYAGVYDTWQDASPDWQWARCATAVLHFYRRSFGEDLRTSEFVAIGKELLKKNELGDLGTMLVQAEDREAREHAGKAYRQVRGRIRFACVEGGSARVNIAARFVRDADIVLSTEVVHEMRICKEGEVRAQPVYRISMRLGPDAQPDLELDLGALAKQFGGGGHRAAAGFLIQPDNWYGYDSSWWERALAADADVHATHPYDPVLQKVGAAYERLVRLARA